MKHKEMDWTRHSRFILDLTWDDNLQTLNATARMQYGFTRLVDLYADVILLDDPDPGLDPVLALMGDQAREVLKRVLRARRSWGAAPAQTSFRELGDRS